MTLFVSGKKDIWLPRSGHTVDIYVNEFKTPVVMTLDSTGRGYFNTRDKQGRKGNSKIDI